MRRRAFTLIELLVTAAIISTLISILLPTLSKAQTAARRVSCASQLKALTLGLNVYASNNNAWLPPGPSEIDPFSGFASDPDRGSPLELFNAVRIGQSVLSSQNGWYNQGLLWQQRAIDQPRFYYCPEMERRGAGFAANWPQHMDVNPDAAGERSVVYSSYLYRGGYASAAGTDLGTLNTTRSAPGEPVFADSAFFKLMVHPGGYNIAYLGGQIEFRPFVKPVVTGAAVMPLWNAVRQP